MTVCLSVCLYVCVCVCACVRVQASRNGIRVGDLINDFDVFTEMYVHALTPYSLYSDWLMMTAHEYSLTSSCTVTGW